MTPEGPRPGDAAAEGPQLSPAFRASEGLGARVTFRLPPGVAGDAEEAEASLFFFFQELLRRSCETTVRTRR